MLERIFAIVVNVVSFAAAAAFMELVARWMHKYIMHRYGWCLHYDHHNHTGRIFQKNDLYSFFFDKMILLFINFTSL